MADADFQHIRMSMVKDVAVVEVRTKEVHGPKMAQELGAELAQVTTQEWARRLLINFRRRSGDTIQAAT
jgi:anti-sigma B factor antagonist